MALLLLTEKVSTEAPGPASPGRLRPIRMARIGLATSSGRIQWQHRKFLRKVVFFELGWMARKPALPAAAAAKPA